MILYNDQLVKRGDVQIGIEDRGYQFGDGVYEVLSVYDSKIFRLKEHLDRLSYCAQQLGITLPVSLAQLETNLYQLIKTENVQNGQLYFQVTRGAAERNHLIPESSQSVLTGYATFKPRPIEHMEKGVSVITTEDIRWLRCDIKSLNLLGSVLAKQKAAEQGAYEAILHRNGIVTEGSASNLFIVKDGKLHTHPTGNLILNGITRVAVIEYANELCIEVMEQPFTLDKLKRADEVFLTSTVNEVMPIIEIDGKTVASGKVGELTRRLQQVYEARLKHL
ncbi:D-amino-acid transaminase [Ammoniphilus oxalaticus]|uniref:D-alanine aminotransferase n=1 Tax=Ammoniphilus oxalaticus TaxID=66863 RepID=A0A419SML5_9BACL|nr:D-amino-acid transaminase [Ammoniphilus oxalaticus]RKD25537.1 D-amino-acid transaminase [Ammoniphilus oxalaticus]